MRDKVIVFYHGNDWDGVAARQRYLMEALSKYIPVVYVDGTADARARVTYAQPQENVTLVRGLVPLLVALKRRRVEFLAGPVTRWHLRWLRKRYKRVLLWNMENWLRLNRYVPHDVLIFDCIDPAFTEDPEDQRRYDKREHELLRASDVVFASASALVEQCRQYHANVTLLNNACAPDEYHPCLLEEALQPQWWPRTDAPIAAYLGSIDLRFDFDVVEYACVHNVDTHFVLAGLVLPQFEARMDTLRALPNVTVPGKISLSDGRYLLSHCRIGLIPFRMGAMNDTINPVKMYAYALLGKPIVGTAVHELALRPDIVRTANTPEAFHTAVAAAMCDALNPDTAAKLQAFALENTWEARAAQAWSLIKDL